MLKAGEDLILVGILTGAYMFAADLSREITVPTRNEFMSVSSYNDGVTSSGEVRIIMDCRNSIRGKHILIMEDIVDSGHTLEFLVRMLEIRRPASIRTCVLLQAPKRKRQIECKVDYLGFDIGDKFVVGYGLDMGGRFRNLPYIAELSTEVMKQLLGRNWEGAGGDERTDREDEEKD